MCSFEHNGKGISLQNKVAKFTMQLLYVWKYKYYINTALEMKNKSLRDGLMVLVIVQET